MQSITKEVVKDISRDLIPIVSKINILNLKIKKKNIDGSVTTHKQQTMVPIDYDKNIERKDWYNGDVKFKLFFKKVVHPTFCIPVDKKYSLIFLISSKDTFKQIKGDVNNLLDEKIKEMFKPVKNINKPQLIKNKDIDKYFEVRKSISEAVEILKKENYNYDDILFKLVKTGTHSLISCYSENKLVVNSFEEKIFNFENLENIIGADIEENKSIKEILSNFENNSNIHNIATIENLKIKSMYGVEIESLVKDYSNKNFESYNNSLNVITNNIISQSINQDKGFFSLLRKLIN